MGQSRRAAAVSAWTQCTRASEPWSTKGDDHVAGFSTLEHIQKVLHHSEGQAAMFRRVAAAKRKLLVQHQQATERKEGRHEENKEQDEKEQKKEVPALMPQGAPQVGSPGRHELVPVVPEAQARVSLKSQRRTG